MEDLSIANNMDSDVVRGLDNSPNKSRMGAISRAASQPQSTELETQNIKMGVAETVKKLEQETQEMSPEKEDVAEVVITENKGDSMKKVDEGDEKKIMGMKPLTFGVVVLVGAIGGYLAYKHFKSKK
jgi:hypothetical protein